MVCIRKGFSQEAGWCLRAQVNTVAGRQAQGGEEGLCMGSKEGVCMCLKAWVALKTDLQGQLGEGDLELP